MPPEGSSSPSGVSEVFQALEQFPPDRFRLTLTDDQNSAMTAEITRTPDGLRWGPDEGAVARFRQRLTEIGPAGAALVLRAEPDGHLSRAFFLQRQDGELVVQRLGDSSRGPSPDRRGGESLRPRSREARESRGDS